MMIFQNDIFGAPSELGAPRTACDAHGGSTSEAPNVSECAYLSQLSDIIKSVI